MLEAQPPFLASRSSTRHAPDAHSGTSPDGQESNIGLLLLRVSDGDVGAFGDLYRRTSHRVYGLVRRVLVDAEMSAETVQDVYLALWLSAAERFDPAQGSGMTWILTLAHRRAVDKVRSEQARRVRDVQYGVKNLEVDYDEAAEPLMRRDEADTVREGLKELSVLQREAIDLAYYGGLTYVQVADRLGIPVPTAKSRIRDGISRLRTALQASA